VPLRKDLGVRPSGGPDQEDNAEALLICPVSLLGGCREGGVRGLGRGLFATRERCDPGAAGEGFPDPRMPGECLIDLPAAERCRGGTLSSSGSSLGCP
jgi:hypothetical protein